MNATRPSTIMLDAFSDPNLQVGNVNGTYSRFRVRLSQPVLNAKSIQLRHTSFVNSLLQLNDNSQLMFWFYFGNGSINNIRQEANLKCIRLHPSDFVPANSFTQFVKNRYFNSVVELCGALTQASQTGGDNVIFNPYWFPDIVSFVYDPLARKINIVPTGNTNSYIAPASADDPFVISAMTSLTTGIRMNSYANVNPGQYASAQPQPFVSGITMNARLGFAMGFNTRGRYWTANSQIGCASLTGVPQSTDFLGKIEGDTFPILLASQNINMYADILNGSGVDAKTIRRNLLATIPIQVAPLNVNVFQGDIGVPALLGIPQELQTIEIVLLDDFGNPFPQPPNFNMQLTIAVEY